MADQVIVHLVLVVVEVVLPRPVLLAALEAQRVQGGILLHRSHVVTCSPHRRAKAADGSSSSWDGVAHIKLRGKQLTPG